MRDFFGGGRWGGVSLGKRSGVMEGDEIMERERVECEIAGLGWGQDRIGLAEDPRTNWHDGEGSPMRGRWSRRERRRRAALAVTVQQRRG